MTGYIYVKNWTRFQHPDALRSGHMPWLKLHTDLLGNDAWLDLSAEDRCLLQTIWMLTARYGYGRVSADQRWLMSQAKLPYGPRSRNLERLNHAGFITIRASKAASKKASNLASTDKEGSYEPKKRMRASASKPQAAAVARIDEPERDDDLNRQAARHALEVLKGRTA